MREFLPLLIVGAIVGVFSIIFVIAYLRVRKQKEAIGFDRNMPDGEIVARAHNRREGEKNALCHAEILAINAACRKIGGWRLVGCTLYVTLEPCPMCAGAILNAQVKQVKVGAADEKMGAFGGCVDLRSRGLFRSEVTFGLLEEESKSLMRDFFSELRRKREKQE